MITFNKKTGKFETFTGELKKREKPKKEIIDFTTADIWGSVGTNSTELMQHL